MQHDTTPRFRAIALVAFAAGKSSDYASHWLRRQAASPNGRPFQLCLTPESLFHGRGDHRVHILDRRAAERLGTLFPHEWPWPSKLLAEHFDSSAEQRVAILLDAFAAAHPAPDASALRRVDPASRSSAAASASSTAEPQPGVVFAAFSEGNGVKVIATGGRSPHKALRHTQRAVLHPYKLVGGIHSADRAKTKRLVHALLGGAKGRVGPARAELFDAPPERATAVFRALRVLRACMRHRGRRVEGQYMRAPPIPVSSQ